MSNEPVAWGVPNTRITERQPFMMLLHSTEGCQYPGMLVPLYTHPVNDTALPRLLRIMGTFDLATGHASTMDEALDELESELRDVLGYYRTAKPDDTALLRQALDALERIGGNGQPNGWPIRFSSDFATVTLTPPLLKSRGRATRLECVQMVLPVGKTITALRERLGEQT